MKKILFITGVLLFFFPLSLGNTAEVLPLNGNDWQNLSQSSKLYFVLGWTKCGKAAIDHLALPIDKLNESIEFANLQQNVFKNEGVLLGGVTIRQIINTIDSIYSDPRTITMDITEIMPFINGRLLYGWTAKELDEVIAIKVRLKQCENIENKKEQFIKECSPLREEMNSYLQKLRKK